MKQENMPEPLEKFIQVLPKEILEELRGAANIKNRSLNEEIAIRLYAAIKAPESFVLNNLVSGILKYKFSKENIKRELEHYKKCRVYQYELDKMEFMIRYEDILPKDFPKDFIFISMEVEGKIIREWLNQEKLKNG